jgi:hypothetical protein
MLTNKQNFELHSSVEFQGGLGSLPNSSRTLHIYCDGHTRRKLRVLGDDKGTELYTATMKPRKPNMIVRKESANTDIGTVNYHTLSTRIDITVAGQTLSLTSRGWTQRHYQFDSPAFSNAKLTWRAQSKIDEMNMALLDDRDMPVARFIPVDWAMKKTGKIEFLNERVTNEELMDEIVVTALAIWNYRHIQRSASAGVVV